MFANKTIPSPVLLAYMYFLQGLPYGLQARFLPLYFRSHGMSLSNISFMKILFFPWLCKPFWAPLVDHHGNKKNWLIWSMLGLGVTCLLAACIEPSWILLLSAILLIFNLLTSTQDIATDGLAIEILTASEVPTGNIAQVVGYKAGAIVGGGLLSWMSEYISWRTIFIFLTLVYGMSVGIIRTLVPENRGYSTDLIVSEPLKVKQKKTVLSHLKKSLHEPNSPEVTQSTEIYTTNSESNDGKTAVGNRNHQEKDMSAPFMLHKSYPNDISNRTGVQWIKDHFAAILHTEGTVWILVYVLVYKLGEQGALNMMPMYLIDGGMTAADVGLWTGVVGQAVSIAASVISGLVISSSRYTALELLKMLAYIKVAVLLGESFVIFAWTDRQTMFGSMAGLCVFLMLLLLIVSGAISTAAFTLMMHCSQQANQKCQASHYSLLATAEVLGKLLFSVFVGAITDMVGYAWAFGLFLTLSVAVLPLFSYAPHCLGSRSESAENNSNKNH